MPNIDPDEGAATASGRPGRAQARHPLVLAVTLVVLLAIPLVVRDEYFLHLFIVSGIFVIVAISLDLIVGYVGQLSLAHGVLR
ncbi:MAG TPA: hypothetical protein VFC24_00315, partial [Casimicrobiaceae bacterium]|nr:hypothetical protein [Casimicrobiaceae bacterium]